MDKAAHFEWDGFNDCFRVWRSTDSNDVFDMVQADRLAGKLYDLEQQGYRLLPFMPEDR